jgi:dihydroorotate dehydrogenase
LARLKHAPLPRPPADDEKLRVEAFGLAFPIRSGSRRDSTRHAEVVDPLLAARLRVRRGRAASRPSRSRAIRARAYSGSTGDEGIINRFGFNSDGVEAVAGRLAARTGAPGIVGINLGSNKDTVDRAADYVACIAALAPHVGFLTVNISSPNTAGLRSLQQASALDDLLARVIEARDRAAERDKRKPLLLKIAPDLTLTDLDGRRRHRAPASHRRHDRGKHDADASRFARPRDGDRAGWALGPPAGFRSRRGCSPKPTCALKARSR